MRKFLIPVLLTLMVTAASARADATVGQPAPALVATTLDGKPFDLSALKDKVVVLHLWATWCPPCREEMPALEAVWRQYHGQGMEALAISADRARARGDVAQVMQYFTFPAATLGDVSKNEFGAVGAIPVTYVIGKDGMLAAVMTPATVPLTESALGDEVKSLLAAKADAKADAAKPDSAQAAKDQPAAAPAATAP